MIKKKIKLPQKVSEDNNSLEMYQVRNLTQNVFSVPYINSEGKVANLQLRIQGRGGQTPPVIPSTAITAQLRFLVKRRFVQLVKISG